MKNLLLCLVLLSTTLFAQKKNADTKDEKKKSYSELIDESFGKFFVFFK